MVIAFVKCELDCNHYKVDDRAFIQKYCAMRFTSTLLLLGLELLVVSTALANLDTVTNAVGTNEEAGPKHKVCIYDLVFISRYFL